MAPSWLCPSLFGFVARSLNRSARDLWNRLCSLAQGSVIALARPTVLSLLSSIELGTLVLVDEPHGECHVFGQPVDFDDNKEANAETKARATTSNRPTVTLRVRSPLFYPRLLLNADMGFAQSYLQDEVTCSDLTSFFRLFILNRDRLNNGAIAAAAMMGHLWPSLLAQPLIPIAYLISTLLAWLMTPWQRNKNTIPTATANTAAHYDLSNALFAAFLSTDMTYSCPIWSISPPASPSPPPSPPPSSPLPSPRQPPHKLGESKKEEEPLETAQHRKLHRFITGLHLKATDHVLEIGTGWGSFAIEAVRTTGCRVTTLTLSREQKAWVEARLARNENRFLREKIEVLLMDYRDEALPVPEGGFDKVVSIEMVEAVGRGFLGVYFARVDQVLKRDGGVAMFQCITMPEGRHGAYEGREDFINKYIFPGGYLPSTTQLLNHITAASRGTLIVERVENIGGHYARALRLWRERFLTNFEGKIRPALMEGNPSMTRDEADVFRRKWEYYFSYCEAGFSTKTLGDVIITVGREGAMELMEGIPL